MRPVLDAVEARILGSLIEKSYLTPEVYPLSFNALLNACNQKTSREPVMTLDVDALGKGLASLREKGLAGERVGARVPKFFHHAEMLRAGDSPEVLGTLAVLLLRGPQTAAEVRARSDRMAQFQENAAVEKVLEGLASHSDGPLVARLARGRWEHLLGGEAPAAAEAPAPAAPPAAAEFTRVYSKAPWEEKAGYCRALRAGRQVFVTGTAALDDEGKPFAPGDPYQQTRRCLELIERALAELGCGRRHVTRTRLFVTDIERWADVGRAHAEFFGEHRPATTMVEVRRLIDPALLVEVEADAVAP